MPTSIVACESDDNHSSEEKLKQEATEFLNAFIRDDYLSRLSMMRHIIKKRRVFVNPYVSIGSVAYQTVHGNPAENVSVGGLYSRCLWVNVGYAADIHGNEPPYPDRDAAMAAIKAFPIPPSIIVDAGVCHTLYWLLEEPTNDKDAEIKKRRESMMRGIAQHLQCDTPRGWNHSFLVPGSMNNRIPDGPRRIETVSLNSELRYDLDTFEVCRYSLAPQIMELVINGGKGEYKSHPEAQAAILQALIRAGAKDNNIRLIFEKMPCGELYREKGARRRNYLLLEIARAEKVVADKSTATQDKAKKGVDVHVVANAVLKLGRLLYVPGLGFFEWQERGVWQRIPDEIILQRIDGFLDDGKRHTRNEVLAVLQIHPDVLLSPLLSLNSHHNLLNLRNGMFRLDRMELLPHDPRYLSTIQLPVSYNPEAECPRWTQFLDEVQPGKSEQLILQELSGYSLTMDTHHEKAFVLIGKGKNGKSVFIETLAFIVGEENTSRVQPTEFGKPFLTIPIMGMLLNVCSDLESHEIVNTGMLKSIISGEPVTDSYKFKDRITFTPFCKLVFGTNVAPKITDRSAGFLRRLVFIGFPITIAEEARDKRLKEKLRSEADGIFLWALEGLRRLRKQDGFTRSQTGTDMLEEYRFSNNPVLQFTEDFIEPGDPSDKVGKQELYEIYSRWSEASGYRAMGISGFYKVLRQEVDLGEVRESSKGLRRRVIVGIRVVGELPKKP